MTKKYLLCALLCLSALFLSLTALADPDPVGKDITKDCTVSPSRKEWLDDRVTTYRSISEGEALRVEADEAIGGIYLRFDKLPTADYLLEANGTQISLSPDYLHRYLDIDALFDFPVTDLTLTFGASTVIADLFVLSPGTPPDFVQIWQPPCEQADLLLAPTHADDEQLFFLGVLPYYAGQMEYDVQVVYFTNHNKVHDRPHELLNGLWAVGVRSYPIIAPMKDAWDGSTETLKYGYSVFASQGYEKKDLVDFWVEMIRRFRPQVIVGHDIDGEYRHPQHMVNTDTLREALKVCGDAEYLLDGIDSAPYEPEKVYLHLLKENPIYMDWDRPLDKFGGLTAYEVSKRGYQCHESQQWTWFTRWIQGKNGQFTKSSEITTYSPNEYGLYFTRVGKDVIGGDFFENVTVRSQIPPETEPPQTLPPETAPITSAPPVSEPTATETAASANLTEPHETAGAETELSEADAAQKTRRTVIIVICLLLIVGTGIPLFSVIRKRPGAMRRMGS